MLGPILRAGRDEDRFCGGEARVSIAGEDHADRAFAGADRIIGGVVGAFLGFLFAPVPDQLRPPGFQGIAQFFSLDPPCGQHPLGWSISGRPTVSSSCFTQTSMPPKKATRA